MVQALPGIRGMRFWVIREFVPTVAGSLRNLRTISDGIDTFFLRTQSRVHISELFPILSPTSWKLVCRHVYDGFLNSSHWP